MIIILYHLTLEKISSPIFFYHNYLTYIFSIMCAKALSFLIELT